MTLRVGLLLLLSAVLGMDVGAQPVEDGCRKNGAVAGTPTSDLYCVELIPRPEIPKGNGYVEMVQVQSPFTVPVSPRGFHRYELVFHLSGLPHPSEVGGSTTYVAWVTSPAHQPMKKLGEVGNGTQNMGELGEFNKFVVLITAEQSPSVESPQGQIVMRGISPSSYMDTHDLATLAPMAVTPAPDEKKPQAESGSAPGSWTMPPVHPQSSMVPGMKALQPKVAPFVASYPRPGTLSRARPNRVRTLTDGDTLDLTAGPVRRHIKGKELVMLGYNGQYPGPLLRVTQGAKIYVRFYNHTRQPTTVHWHGLRLDNAFDGVPGITQEPVEPGGDFLYEVRFPDAGLYWYHPHVREDIQQDLGLYGNMRVAPSDSGYFNPVHREEALMLDDLLLEGDSVVPYGDASANYMFMGRFGNTMLVNGAPQYERHVRRGEVVRFLLTNVSNTRTFNLSFGDLPVKVIGSDVSKYEREVWSDNIVIAPAERYMVEVQFPNADTVGLTNTVQGINHRLGSFFTQSDTLGRFVVRDDPVERDLSASFEKLRPNPAVIDDIEPYRDEFDGPVDRELVLRLEVDSLPTVVDQLMRLDATYFNPVEWAGTMPMMNWASTGHEVKWILEDPETGKRNMDIDWRFQKGDVVKVRITNDRRSFHAMQHPIHIHGQRFLVLSHNGVPNDNLVWKDTVLVPVGTSVEILLELSNPGTWMAHCHIAEHLESGMKMAFEVEE